MTRFSCFSNGLLLQIHFTWLRLHILLFEIFFFCDWNKQIIHFPSPEPLLRLSLPACLSCVALPASASHLPYPEEGTGSGFLFLVFLTLLLQCGHTLPRHPSQEPCIFFLRYNLSATKTYSMVWRASLHLLKNHYGAKSSRMLKWCHWCGFLV